MPLDIENIRAALDPGHPWRGNLTLLDAVDSTMDAAKRALADRDHPPTTFALFAREQTAGRGRQGRGFASSRDLGIWMTAALPVSSVTCSLPLSTIAAGIAVARTTHCLYHLDCRIKWPNDILIRGRKVCGILGELVNSGRGTQYLLIGVGLNVHQAASDFPAEIAGAAISIESALRAAGDPARPDIDAPAANLLGALWENLTRRTANEILREYDRCECLSGQPVTIQTARESLSGTAGDITPDGALRVILDRGERAVYRAAEVHLASKTEDFAPK